MNCIVCGKESMTKTCSGACRAKLSRRKRTVPGARIAAHAPSARYITDATGAKHTVDYEGRRKNYATLKAWAEGKGTAWQHRLGNLAMGYNELKDLDVEHYLGLA